MAYRAVLFDMDGVIVDSEPLHKAAFRVVLKRYGHRISDEQYNHYFAGKTDEDGFRRYFDAIKEIVDLSVIVNEKAKIYRTLSASKLTSYPGVIELVNELTAREIPLALVTGALRRETEIILQTFGVIGCFQVVLTAEDVHHSKPNPEGYLKAAVLLGVNPVDCVVIEDTPSGVAAAKGAGMQCLAVTTTHSATALTGATRIIDSLSLEGLDSA